MVLECAHLPTNRGASRTSRLPSQENPMRRSLAVSALAASIIGLSAAPAWAHGGDDGHGDGGDPVVGEWEALPPSEPFPPVDACGTSIIVAPGDVDEGEARVIDFPSGKQRVEFRGNLTVDIVRAEDGKVLIDELDVSGPGADVISP